MSTDPGDRNVSTETAERPADETFIPAEDGMGPALQAADELEAMADQIITPRDSPSAQKLRLQAANIRAIVKEFARLRVAVWPGLPKFEPTAEKPQEDFYILAAEGFHHWGQQNNQLVVVLKDARDWLRDGMPKTALKCLEDAIDKAEGE